MRVLVLVALVFGFVALCSGMHHHDGHSDIDEPTEETCRDWNCEAEEKRFREWYDKLPEDEKHSQEVKQKLHELGHMRYHCCDHHEPTHEPHPDKDKCKVLTCTKKDFEWIWKMSEEERRRPEIRRKIREFKHFWGFCCRIHDMEWGMGEPKPEDQEDMCAIMDYECEDYSTDEDDDDGKRDYDDRMTEEMRYCCANYGEQKGHHDRHHRKKVAMIAGMSVGLLALVILLLVVACCCLRRKSRPSRQRKHQPNGFENMYYGGGMQPPALGYEYEKKKPLPEGDINASTPYETIPADHGLKPELILTAPPSYDDSQYDNSTKK